MRTENSIKNSATSLVSNLLAMLIGFVSQAIFVRLLGAGYLGLNGFFTNIMTMFNFFELGIGNAIVFHLYKPILNNELSQIKSLMDFYKKTYRIIASLILFIGIIFIPFLNYFIDATTLDINIIIVYLMFLISTVSSYLLMYKRNLIYANQKSYVSNIIHIIYLLGMNILQIIVLILTRNYYLYLLLKIFFQIIENIINNIIANKMYPYLLEKNFIKLDKKIKEDIFIKVKALIYHKIGNVIVNGTDNIIISKFFGVITIGIYTNYALIVNSIRTLINQVITSTTASVGNLLASNEMQKKYEVFKKIWFVNFILSCFSAVCILSTINSFIRIWIGKEYLLNLYIVIVIVINFYQSSMRSTFSTFKDSAGIWKEDKYVPIIESVLNILFSVVFLKLFGLVGVFMGTIVSSFILWCYSYPKFVYKNIFEKSYFEYFMDVTKYFALFLILLVICYNLSIIYICNNAYVDFIKNVMISVISSSVILFIIFRKTDNFIYFTNILKKKFKRI